MPQIIKKHFPLPTKFAFIGSYLPRKCGIATFTNNLIKSVVNSLGGESILQHAYVVAMNDQGQEYNYPPEVKFVINQNEHRDYLAAAQFINYNEADICILEHEFGIFGGESGAYILHLVERLEIPLMVTFHTILHKPTPLQKTIIRVICRRACKVIVMSERAVEFLVQIYNVPKEKIKIIEHGVPVGRVLNREAIRTKFNFGHKKVLFTFGLLSRNKGIENVIKALPEVIQKHGDVLYIILGKTHPAVIRERGEEYREFLLRMVKDLKLENHVYFYTDFVTDDRLFEYLSAIDIYITPYLNEAQITSGTLAYAIGAGAAVISTPYWHATELLSEGRGKLFDFHDSGQLQNIILELLDNPDILERIRKNAFDYGQKLKWPRIGTEYVKTACEVTENFICFSHKLTSIIDPQLMPVFNMSHAVRLTDNTGIVQHAKYGIPNLKEGYCLDDNSRALLMSLMTYRIRKEKEALRLLPIYLSFIHYMQNEDGTFRNFLSYSRQYLDKEGSEDVFGRTIWALGYLINYPPNDSYLCLGLEIFSKSIQHSRNLKHTRGIANTIIGLSYYVRKYPHDKESVLLLEELTGKIVANFEKGKDKNWIWFDDILTYDNGVIPYSLLNSAEVLNDSSVKKLGLEILSFLEEVTMRDGYLMPVGSNGWFVRSEQPAVYAQQSIDVMAMVLAYYRAYISTNDTHFLKRMFKCFMWYTGENNLNIPVYDFETGGCNDGLEEHGVNRNQGAESTLAYLISYLTVLSAFGFEYEYEKKIGE
ncbi:MAG: glycosyltransferase family 4 protein [Ignavibacteriae bacterium]|nr:glycosyltransferase family 4 protein [Ignavibacteriota bacterium]